VIISTIFTALRGMQTRSSDENSVCLSVGPRLLNSLYLLTSGLPRHLQHFVGSWKLIYFGNLTRHCVI